MKKIFSFLPMLLLAGALFGQLTSNRTVTINVTGSRNKQIVIDDKTYPITTTVNGEQTIIVNDLSLGTHTMELVRSGFSNIFQASSLTNFTVREGYDLEINVSSNGTVNVTEVRARNRYQSGQGLSSYAFTRLYNNVRSQTGASRRTTYLENQFSNTNRFYTSQQAKQLIQLVNSENLRLRLAKDVYPRIVDRENFSLVSSLLYSNRNRAELSRYIATLPDDVYDNGGYDNTGFPPITDVQFRVIYNEVSNENSMYDRNYYLHNYFARNSNYYTSEQARQLIQLVPGETERFTLSKEAYRGVTDKVNYYNTIQPLLSSNANRTALWTFINSGATTNYPTYGTPMNTVEFNNLYRNISNTWSGNRVNLESQAFQNNNNYFTVDQVRQLLILVNSESDRLTLAKSAYDNVIDRSNFSQLYDVFTNTSYRNELARFVMDYQTGTTYPNTYPNTNYRTPMSSSQFSRIYDDVQHTFGLGAKMSSLRDIFNNESNYFTVEQTHMLIQLVSAEYNRLELAKAAYSNLTDPVNYTQLYDLFETQSSRDELTAYVNANPRY